MSKFHIFSLGLLTGSAIVRLSIHFKTGYGDIDWPLFMLAVVVIVLLFNRKK